MIRFVFYFLFFIIIIHSINCQSGIRHTHEARWCSVGKNEMRKCKDWALAMRQSGQFILNLTCIETKSKEECFTLIDENEADLVTLDPGEVFIGGRFHSLVPIMVERYGTASDSLYYSVAVIHRSSDIRSLEHLRNRPACFSGVDHMASWVLPISTLLKKRIMDVVDCNNHLKSVAAFFGPSCAPNALIDLYNPTGDNPHRLCDLCGGKGKLKCSGADPYAGFDGAFRCLTKGGGQIAFVKHTTITEMAVNPLSGVNKQNFELLCPDGRRVSVDSFATCHWGFVLNHAVMTSSATSPEMRKRFQEMIKKSVQHFGGPPPNTFPAGQPNAIPFQPSSERERFTLFQSIGRYNDFRDLLFQDMTTRLDSLEESRQTFMDYLGKYQNDLLELRQCPVKIMKLCVVSDMELEKCLKMRAAFHAQLLQPKLDCFKGYSHNECITSIAQGTSDVAILDAGDVYTAGKDYGLIPIMAEQYNLDGPYYYAVAVASIENRDADLLFLRGRYTCHTGMNMAAGWVIPISFLLQNQRLRNYGCDGVKAAAEFFQKSCVPGALSSEYNHNWKQNNLCDLCHGSSGAFCQRDHNEDFYGSTGAFRCLVEGGGEIAFVKHTSVFENTDGRNRMWWARNQLAVDFELLCRDGSRAPVHEYSSCNLGKVPGNAIVARPNNETEINSYINLFLYAQQFYGSKYVDDFKFHMFQSDFPYSDLIFQDATQQIVAVRKDRRHYHAYLGHDFLQAKQAVDCTAAGIAISVSLWLIITVSFLNICCC